MTNALVIIILSYFLFINIIAFILYGLDKKYAVRKMTRIPSFVLLWMARLGGGLGCWLGMSYFHHKKNHTKYRKLIPLWSVIWLCALVLVVIMGTENLPTENGISRSQRLSSVQQETSINQQESFNITNTIIIASYLLLINIIAFILYGIDKKHALNEKTRIPSSVLLWMARLGGGLGCWLGMLVFHHKKNHSRFKRIIPIWIIIWMFIFAFIIIMSSGDLGDIMNEIKEMQDSRRNLQNTYQ